MKNIERRDVVFLILTGLFVTNAVLAEIIGGKLIVIAGYTMTIGVIPWPVVFISTDLVNEYFGQVGVRRLTLLTVGLIVYAFIILFASMMIPAASFSPVQDSAFSQVFSQSLWIIVGSLTAFVLSQLLDSSIFKLFRVKTQGRYLWLRSTGSTVVSQLIDTMVVLGIAFLLPKKITFENYLELVQTSYTYKLLIAILLTPLIYAAHALIDRYLGHEESKKLQLQAFSS